MRRAVRGQVGAGAHVVSPAASLVAEWDASGGGVSVVNEKVHGATKVAIDEVVSLRMRDEIHTATGGASW